MGSCCSKRVPDAPLGLQSVNYPLTVAGDTLQVGISACGWLSALSLAEQIAICQRPHYTLAALFEGIDRGTVKGCSHRVMQVLENNLRFCGGSPKESLEQTLLALLPNNAQGALGGMLLYLDHKTRRLYAASQGQGRCSFSELQHGLAAQYTSGSFLCTTHTDHQHNTTHRQGLSRCRVVEMQLMQQHELFVIGSPQLWKLMDKDEIALRGHFHIQANFCGNEQAVRPDAPDKAAAVSAADRLPNTAQYLVTHARDKSHCQEGPQFMRPFGTDIIAIAITLRWPSTSVNQAFARAELAVRDRQLSLAALRWRRIKALSIECPRARRHLLTHKWQELAQLELQAGRKRARALETRAWLEQGLVLKLTPSLKAVGEHGHAVALPHVISMTASAAQ